MKTDSLSDTQEEPAPDIDFKEEYFKVKAVLESEKEKSDLKITSLQNENERLKLETHSKIREEVQSVLKGTFSQTQIDIILKKNMWRKTLQELSQLGTPVINVTFI
uniref:Uncharacterized protein n=1 Tax=Graphocephala atropunctata TaxID=36148 RepID=A0A1B6LP48_9HEMI